MKPQTRPILFFLAIFIFLMCLEWQLCVFSRKCYVNNVKTDIEKTQQYNHFRFSWNRTMKILFYTGQSTKDIEEDRYIFRTCPDAKNWDSTRESKSDISRKRLRHLLQCSHGQDVVIFHVKDLPGPKLLQKAKSLRVPGNQLWGYYNKESPFNSINLIGGKYDGIFHLVITPKRDSDVPAPYGYYRKRISNSYHLSLDPVISRKKHGVAWIASHCNEERDTLVASLMRYFSIHVFGKCGRKFNQNRICLRDTSRCNKLLKNYKFVLAFENSQCLDYVTEKYWNALSRGTIPIVYGGSNYDHNLVIPGSFINVKDFKSVKELANHVIEVNKTYSHYLKYQEWRNTYEIDFKPNDRHRFEIIGEKIYQLLKKGLKIKTYKLSRFYGRKENCVYHQSIKALYKKGRT